MEGSLVFHRILKYLNNIDLVEEHLSTSSTFGEHKEDEACEDSLEGVRLPAADAADRLSANQRK